MATTDRSRTARLDTALAKLADAEKAALESLRAAGFNFQTIAQARSFQTRTRAALRAQANAIDLMYMHSTERKK